MAEKDTDALRKDLAELSSEHSDLNDVIDRLIAEGSFDQIQMQRLKKRKLLLKDEIAQLESQLLPDIIA